MHLMIDSYDCQAEPLGDAERVSEFLLMLPDKIINMQRITEPRVITHLDPSDIDVFSCMDFDSQQQVCEIAKEFFGMIGSMKTLIAARGLDAITPGNGIIPAH